MCMKWLDEMALGKMIIAVKLVHKMVVVVKIAVEKLIEKNWI